MLNDFNMSENLMCPPTSCMAPQMPSQLQKGVIAEVSDSACLRKKVKIHLGFLHPGNKIDSLLAQKKENCY